MPTILSHPAVPIALFTKKIWGNLWSKSLLRLCIFLTIIPDGDVITFKFGIPYESQWGHRGFTHSIAFALITGLVCQLFSRKLQAKRWMVFIMTSGSVLSHALLDGMTNGGKGVALFWPLTNERFFLPWQPIEVSPIGVAFFSVNGLMVLASEALWIWLPFLIVGLILKLIMRQKSPS